MSDDTAATEAKIKAQLAEHPVLLYMKGSADFPQCGFSQRAIQILRACGADFSTIDILKNPDIRAVLPTMMEWPTFPQLYIEGELIGGSDIMLELYQSGELQTMLKQHSLST